MKAIVMTGETGKVALETDRPPPKLRPGYVLVTVKAVAVNPTDWKHADTWNTKGCLSGCDYAGVVAQTGTGYSKKWKVGDRICGFVNGGNELQPEDGAFAETIVARADVQIRVPDNMSFAEAATLGSGVWTAGQGLFQSMGLNNPATSQKLPNNEIILIYGGSTAMGSLGIQFAKLAGYTPIATCSPRNFEFVTSRGAVAAFDYRDPNCAGQIKEYVQRSQGSGLRLIWDTVSTPAAAELCARILEPGGIWGHLLLSTKFPRDDVKVTYSLAYLAAGEPIKKGIHEWDRSAAMADFEWMTRWVPYVEELLEKGLLKAHPQQVDNGGLDKIPDGLELMRNELVSGKKLVYTL